jgi:hypothetical protein
VRETLQEALLSTEEASHYLCIAPETEYRFALSDVIPPQSAAIK